MPLKPGNCLWAILLCVLCSLPGFGLAQAPQWQWVESAATAGTNISRDIVSDSAGNTYICGEFNALLAPPYSLTSSSNPSGFVSKHDPNGNVIWSFAITGNGAQECMSIAMDDSGFFYVTGYFSNTVDFRGRGSVSVLRSSISGTNDVFVAKYDSAGVLQWVETGGGSFQSDVGLGVFADHDGVYVCGIHEGAANFGSVSFGNFGPPNGFILMYPKGGGNPLWGWTLGDAFGIARGVSVVADSNSVYTTGLFTASTLTVPNGPNLSNGSFGSPEIYLLKYSKTGTHNWGWAIGSDGEEYVGDLAIDAGGLYLTGGGTSGSTGFSLPGSTPIMGLVGRDVFVTRLSTQDGTVIWADTYRDQNAMNSQGEGITIDASGRLYVTGEFFGDLVVDGDTLRSTGAEDVFVVRVDTASGSRVWAKQMGITGSDEGLGIATDKNDCIYNTGYYTGGPVPFDTVNAPLGGGANFYVCKLCDFIFANPDSACVNANGSVRIGILGNDFATGSGTSTVTFPGAGPVGGTVTFSGMTDTLQYFANAGYTGVDSFLYSVCNAGNCDTTFIKIQVIPNAMAGTDDTLCTNNGQLLNANVATPGTGMWTSNVGSISFNDSSLSNATADGLQPGINELIWSVSGTIPGCAVSRDTVLITSSPDYRVDLFADPDSVCVGTNAYVKLSTTGNFGPWFIQFSDGATTYNARATGPLDSIPFPLSTTTTFSHVVTVDTLGCPADTSSGPFQIRVDSLPTVNLGTDFSICTGDTSALLASRPNSAYLWSDGTNGASIPVFSAGLYWVEVTDTLTGCSNRDSLNLGLDTLPVVVLRPDTSLCLGTTDTVDAGLSGVSYSWSTGDTTRTAIGTPGTVLSLVVSDTNGCKGSDSVVFSLDPGLLFSLGADTTICRRDSLILKGPDPNWTYLWNSTFTRDSLRVDTTGFYDVLAIDTLSGCAGRDTIFVTEQRVPNIFIGNDTTLCQGDSLVLDASLIGGSFRYSWNTGDTTAIITASQAGTFSVLILDSLNCRGGDLIRLEIQQLPAQISLGVDTALCPGDSILLNASPGGVNDNGINFTWSTGSSLATISGTGGNTYTVVIEDTLQCGTVTDSIVLGTLALPVPGNLPVDTFFCLGDSVLLDATVPGASYTWSTGSPLGQISLATAGFYTVTITDANTCRDTFQVEIRELRAQVSLDGLDSLYCATDDPVILSGMPAGGTWSGPGVIANAFYPTAITTDSVLQVIYTAQDSLCLGTDTVTTRVARLPPAANAGADQELSGGTETFLDAVPPPQGLNGIWSLLSGAGVIADTTDPLSQVTGLAIGENVFIWTISGAPCPSTSDQVRILAGALQIPNGFSPNGDGDNDFFEIPGIEQYTDRVLTVFNRWGNEVFESPRYNNDWDGSNLQGNPLTDDTYYYILDLGEEKFNGFVVIKR